MTLLDQSETLTKIIPKEIQNRHTPAKIVDLRKYIRPLQAHQH